MSTSIGTSLPVGQRFLSQFRIRRRRTQFIDTGSARAAISDESACFPEALLAMSAPHAITFVLAQASKPAEMRSQRVYGAVNTRD
jgi:hypothetical protein